MRNLFKFMVFGILAFSRVEGCQKCFNKTLYAHQLIDGIIEEIKQENEIEVSKDFIAGYEKGCKTGLMTALKILNEEHPETKIRFDD